MKELLVVALMFPASILCATGLHLAINGDIVSIKTNEIAYLKANNLWSENESPYSLAERD